MESLLILTPTPPNCVGPFLMKPTPTSMGFWVYIDDTQDHQLEVVTNSNGSLADTIPMFSQDLNSSKVYLAEIPNSLIPLFEKILYKKCLPQFQLENLFFLNKLYFF